ncbi:efflux RND transporter permease subunit [Novosphingobium resinovorum]|uniref:efflux RND transporter permease subunit n=1 Tax=Sphingomonadaceae TaxID=41297 RepID=UPI00027CA341|nr:MULTISPECIES: efflux RND transporter permease subunit [Sphingomonadaceae]EJU12872.1 acriflavin resistance protein [Sphingomonas sp. LH128]MBF7014479.1 efflux RND transporter permease subunit [Novosphingobium sp. HR1a]WJM25040.1 efflux RND transporter permease subunit [Novosphingobium resinovorum]
MKNIIKLALHRPYTVVVLAILILIYGLSAVVRTPVDIFPSVNVPVVSAVFSYNGLSPDQMSGRIVTFYERALTGSVNNIEHVESQSLPGYGIVKIYFQPSVDINAALAQVTATSQTVLKQMPAGITSPTILSFDASSVPVLQLALSSKTLPDTTLFDQASAFIRPQLASVAGASVPLPYGGKVRQVQADLNPQALQQYGLSANDVTAALASQNLIIPAGTQKIGNLEYTINLNASPDAMAKFNDLPIKTVNGATVYMRDVAFVHDGNPPQTNVVHVDGGNAVLLSIIKSGATSTLDVINGVTGLLPAIRDTLPAGLNLLATGDQSVFVTSAVSGVVREGVIAAALTGLMILIFLGNWRSTLIILVSIPLSILASLGTLAVLGQTINVMTLGGLALAVGILVDDATVTIENINAHLEGGEDVRDAVLYGSEQIVQPATVSLLCICIAFVPMFWLNGVSGSLFRPLAEAVVFALIASYLLSRTLVPAMADRLLKPIRHGEAPTGGRISQTLQRAQRRFEAGFETLRAYYLGLLELALGRRRPVVIGFIGLSLLSLCLYPLLGQDFFPQVDGGQIRIHMRAQTGTRIEATTRTADQVSTAIRDILPHGEVAGVVSNIGLSVSGINMAYDNAGTIGTEDASIQVSLAPEHGETADYVKTLREELPRRFPGVDFAFLPADMVSQILNFGTPAPIDLQIVGSDLAANRAYATALLARIRKIPGVADARIQQAFQQPALSVSLDRSMAGAVGINARDTANAMLTTFSGSGQVAPTYWLDPKTSVSYPVAVQMPQRDITSLDGLKNIPLTPSTASAGQTPELLRNLADISRAPNNALISHYNVRPVIDIYATPQGRDLGAVAADVNKIVADAAKTLPKGSSVALRGQVATMTSAYTQLFVGLAFAILLIYLLIVVNFQSWLDPLVIVLGLPTALAGIVWMLFATGTTMSVPALTGAILCMGVATANSILLIAFARERLDGGSAPLTAAMEAGAARFRPVLMTASAMILGMIPMAIEPGQNMPLGRAVIGGLLFATCATLVLVPTLFAIVHGAGKVIKRDTSGIAPEPATI